MSLQKYKKIEDNRGFFIEDRDSSIFERTNERTFYGNGENDVIKFVLYDVNENVLPQEGYGNERFIHSSDFGEYFRIRESDVNNQAEQYEIDVDKLIHEAGYKTGIFNVEILLVNDRVGSNHDTDKLWIHEISPSRTEIRVVPLQNDNEDLQSRLNERYNAFINNDVFLDDLRENINQFLDVISVTNIEQKLINLYGTTFLNQMKVQFFPNGGFNTAMIRIVEDFKDAVRNVILHRNSSIGSTEFGVPLETRPPITLNISTVIKTKLRDSIRQHLPMLDDRTERNSVFNRRIRDEETQQTIDRVIRNSNQDGNEVEESSILSYEDDTYTKSTDGSTEETVTIAKDIAEDVTPPMIEAPAQDLRIRPPHKVDKDRLKKLWESVR